MTYGQWRRMPGGRRQLERFERNAQDSVLNSEIVARFCEPMDVSSRAPCRAGLQRNGFTRTWWGFVALALALALVRVLVLGLPLSGPSRRSANRFIGRFVGR